MLFYHGQAKEVAEGIQRVAQVRCYGLPEHLGQWCFAYIRPEQPTVITATENSTTSYQ